MLVVFISFQAFIFGYFKIQPKQSVRLTYAVTIGLVVMIGIMTSNIIQDGNSAYRYAASVDNRIENLEFLQKQGLKEVVEVAPIEVPYTTDPKYLIFNLLGKKSNPQPVLYYISDTDTEPNEYAYHLQKVYQFDFLIKLQQPTTNH
jgi:K+-sensing histidine kinase KdpD